MSKTPGGPFLVDMYDLKMYLEEAIGKWRQAKIDADLQKAGDDALMAMCYIDAFQSVHVSAFGELLS